MDIVNKEIGSNISPGRASTSRKSTENTLGNLRMNIQFLSIYCMTGDSISATGYLFSSKVHLNRSNIPAATASRATGFAVEC